MLIENCKVITMGFFLKVCVITEKMVQVAKEGFAFVSIGTAILNFA